MPKSSENTAALDGAMFQLQQVGLTALKKRRNDHLNSRYADLGIVWDAIRAHLQALGLVVRQTPHSETGEVVYVTTRITHVESGEWTEGTLGCKPSKYDPQGLGSAITYLRRYGLCAMLGIVTDDDDGQGASRQPGTGRAVPPKKPAEPGQVTKGELIELVRKWANLDKKATADITAAMAGVKRKLGIKGDATAADMTRMATFVTDSINDGTDFGKWLNAA